MQATWVLIQVNTLDNDKGIAQALQIAAVLAVSKDSFN